MKRSRSKTSNYLLGISWVFYLDALLEAPDVGGRRASLFQQAATGFVIPAGSNHGGAVALSFAPRFSCCQLPGSPHHRSSSFEASHNYTN
jgi:hypothetical protein